MITRLTCPKCGTADVQATGERRYHCAQCGTALGLYPLPSAGAIHCPQCRATVLGDALFCHQCGASVQTFFAAQPCPACGQLMPAASSFCPYCRTSIVSPEGEMSHESVQHREPLGCPACGHDIGPTAQVCPYCGVNIAAFLAPLRRQAMDNLAKKDKEDQEFKRRWQQDHRSPPTNRTFVAAALALSLLLLIGLVLLLFIIRNMGGL